VTSLLELQLDDGGSIVVEVDDRRGPVTRGMRESEALVRGSDTFDAALARVAPAFKALVARVRDAGQPDEIEIEFGLKLNTEVGVVIARTSGEANFRVSAKWTRGT
jgi:hypothetical protein